MVLSKKEISLIKQFFFDKPVLRAYLFGSFSRNEADEKSDVDILVDLDYSRHIGLGFVSMQNQLEDLLSRKVDLVSSQAVSEHIAPFIDEDKQLIYEKTNR
jgi:predicted nucleotidyltransferase